MDRRRIRGWMLFDVAQQPYATLGLTFVFGPYFAEVAAGTFAAAGATPDEAAARAATLWGTAQTVAGLAVAVLALFLGALVDASGRRLPWIVALSVPYLVGAWGLWWLHPDGANLIPVLVLFWTGFMAGEAALNVNNAQLPDLAEPAEIGRISGSGSALGYWGGVAALLVVLLLLAESGETGLTLAGLPPALGLDAAAREGTRAVGPFIALWFVAFMVPYVLWTGDPRPAVRPVREPVGRALRRTFRDVAARPSLASFLAASMLYRDGLGAIYAFGAIYAALILGWDTIQIGVFGVVAAVAAAVITWAGGRLDRRVGPKPVIVASCVALIAVSLVIIGVSRESFFGVPLPAGSALPDALFFVCGGLIGGAGGTMYAASRTLMARHAVPGRAGEAFGLFGLTGRATAFLGPALYTGATALTGSVQWGFAPVIALFLVALVLLAWTRPDGDLP